MTDKTVRGRFVWHELMTPDTSAAHSFYSKTLGWKTQASDQVPDYSMFVAGGNPLGGSMALPAGAPHWLAYIGTPDIEASVEKARELGAKVVKEVEEIPGMGKYAVLNDPQGAAFALYSSESGDAGNEKPPKRGEFSWHELMTTDAKAALDFYSELFGWERGVEHDMGPMGFYYLINRNGQEIGGMFDKPADVPGGPAWLPYVRVKDVHQTVKKVKSAGGTLTNPPTEVPGGDWVAQFIDPHGAAFAVHMLKSDLAAPAQANGQAAAAEPESVTEADEDEEAEAPVAKPKAAAKPKAKAKKSAKPAAAPRAEASKKSAAKKKAPVAAASKQRAAAKSAKRPAAKASKSSKASKASKSSKASKASKAPAKKAAPTKGAKGAKASKAKRGAAKKPARKK